MQRYRYLGLALALLLVYLPAAARIEQREADQLRNRLTPLGAERAANAAGTIPEWRGGLTAPPPCHAAGQRYCNPFAADKPLTTISATNLDAWRDQLPAGQIDLLLRHPQTYRIAVYPSRRSFANPGAVYEAAYRNALKASLAPSGNAVREAALAVPFPVPKNGVEPIWNHRLRYRGPGYSRRFSQASVTTSGEASLVRVREDVDVPYASTGSLDEGVALRWLQVAMNPERLHGYLSLFHESLDTDHWPQKTWRQFPEPSRIRKEKTFGFDNAGMLSDDLRFDDQLDTYFGSPQRYSWRIVAKRELVVPYNSYAMHSGRGSLRELIRPGHLDPKLARHELHRVWVVEANLKPNATHRYKRRTFYIDEDSWQILGVDLYDRDDRLWRWQEVHTIMAYDRSLLMPSVEAIYDFDSSRYLVTGIDEGDPERVETSFDADRFTPSDAQAQVPRRQ
ncbi:MAG: DUF1329 domain-containing protein [Panacagrimonas sp.]